MEERIRLAFSPSEDALQAASEEQTTEVHALTAAARDGCPVELQRVWMTAARRRVSNVVVVPVSAGPVGAAFARDLAEAGRRLGGQVKLIRGEGANTAEAERLASEAAAHVLAGGLAVVTVDPLERCLGGFSLITSADAAVVVVQLGEVAIDEARATVDAIGRDRVLGCVAVGSG